jgi:hypothetical protein
MNTIIFLVLLFCTFALSFSNNNKHQGSPIVVRDDMNLTYGELTKSLIVPALAVMNSNMHTLNSTSLPPDVKLLRNNLLSVRNILDVFAFAYPFPPSPSQKNPDVFLIAREDINQGYTWIGNFKDLSDSHVNYTYDEMVALRNKCLNWQATYAQHSQKYDYPTYLSNPSSKLFVRNPDDLSVFFWGATDGLIPALNMTGYQNIAYLMHSLTEDALKQYPVFLNLTDIYVPTTQLVFHGYRKLIRGIDSVSTFAMEIYKPGTKCVSAAITQTTTLYSMIGKIEDHITAYNFYVKNHDETKAEKEEVVIGSMFDDLKTWMNTNHPDNSLRCLQDSLIDL